MTTMAKQMMRVITYLEEYGSVTRLQAMEDIGVANITAVITKLRKAGYNIETERVKTKNRYGEPVVYGRWVYKGKVEENNG